MAEIVAIADFKARKLAHAEAEWLRLMDLIDKLQADGKFEAAKPLLEKTKAIRVTIDKLRAPPRRRNTGAICSCVALMAATTTSAR